MLFPTTLVGSYPQPEWLIDREKLAGRFPPRVRAKELWRVPEPYLAAAQYDANLLAIRAQDRAGVDIITAGAPGDRARIRPDGAQPRAGGRHWNHSRARLLRLRGDHPLAALRLFLPTRARRLLLLAGLDRDRAVAP